MKIKTSSLKMGCCILKTEEREMKADSSILRIGRREAKNEDRFLKKLLSVLIKESYGVRMRSSCFKTYPPFFRMEQSVLRKETYIMKKYFLSAWLRLPLQMIIS